MACKLHTNSLLPLVLLTFFLLPSTPLSSYPNNERDEFMKWISWNVQNHKRTVAWQLNSNSGVLHGGSRSLDMKLAKAEAAATRYIVNQNGSGNYKSIREAIDSIPLHNTRRVILEIRSGIYREKIVIPKSMSFITFLGNGASPPVITGNDTAATRGKDGVPLNTFHSPTVAVNANYFVAANIKFENTAPYPEVGTTGGQAVARRISGDKAAFYNCSFYGSQDTLYDHKGLHYFNNCFIQGSVDFIFGYGRSLYENCYLNSITKRVASLTAQKGSLKTMESGFSFLRSTITGSGLVYLGRAWGDHSRVVFSYTYMDKVVIPEGWNSWGIQRPETSGVYYGEYQCSGPGANWTGRVHWARLLTDKEAQPFLGTYYVYGDSCFYGSQDTLYDPKGLHYFNNCFIQGSVDFIFGYGRSLYENCYLNSIAKRVASLTAQKGSLKTMEAAWFTIQGLSSPTHIWRRWSYQKGGTAGASNGLKRAVCTMGNTNAADQVLTEWGGSIGLVC